MARQPPGYRGGRGYEPCGRSRPACIHRLDHGRVVQRADIRSQLFLGGCDEYEPPIRRPAFQGQQALYGPGVERIAAKPVHRLRRIGYDATGGKNGGPAAAVLPGKTHGGQSPRPYGRSPGHMALGSLFARLVGFTVLAVRAHQFRSAALGGFQGGNRPFTFCAGLSQRWIPNGVFAVRIG